ncbi:hypothetical protein A2U01_0048490, partial [Trifolium medium]|nr:hypothetical protein [Trifolium medium]
DSWWLKGMKRWAVGDSATSTKKRILERKRKLDLPHWEITTKLKKQTKDKRISQEKLRGGDSRKKNTEVLGFTDESWRWFLEMQSSIYPSSILI